MLAPWLVAMLCLAVAGQSPQEAYQSAYSDMITRVAPEDRHTTRYLTLSAVPVDKREDYVKAIIFSLNSTSFRSVLAKPVVIADEAANPSLLRIDLESLEWDCGSRSVRLKELERRGVDFGLKDAEDRRLFVDPWERFALDDPFFLVTQEYKGHVVRGWLDPTLEYLARKASNSVKLVLRADWLLSRLMYEKGFRGYYSFLLMLPNKEASLYSVLGVDIKLIDRDNKLRRGGAVLDSIVAINNRELQLIPGSYGQPVSFIYRTFDVNVDARGDKSVLESFGGTLKHDGREIIFTLPNGLHGYYLADGKGDQADVVPETIAQIKSPLVPVKETRVQNGAKCLECHAMNNGIIPFDDVVRKGIENPAVALVVRAGEKYGGEAAAVAGFLEDYYRSELGQTIQLHRGVYEAKLREACGLPGLAIATAVLTATEHYRYDLVGPEDAAREVGLPLPRAAAAWRSYVVPETGMPNPVLALLSVGQAVRRAAWEGSYADAQRSIYPYPWETQVKAVQQVIKVPVAPAPVYVPPVGQYPR